MPLRMRPDTEETPLCKKPPWWYVATCPRQFGAHLRGRGGEISRDMHFAARLNCGAWHCPSCSLTRREEWYEHLSEMFHDEETIYKATVGKDDWPRVSAQMRRDAEKAGVTPSFATVAAGPDKIRVYASTPDHGTGDLSAGASVPLTPEEAVRSLDRDLAALPLVWEGGEDVRRPVHVSKDWGLPPRESGKYERLGKLPADAPERVLRAAAETRLPCGEGGPRGDSIERAVWVRFPADWDEARVSSWWEWLEWGRPEGVSFEQWFGFNTC
jgi:hypothetical protein